MTARFLVGDVFDRMAELPDGSIDLVMTSPPFLALRSYLPADHPDKGKEIGSEPNPAVRRRGRSSTRRGRTSTCT